MLPAILWIGIGIAAAVLTAIRTQLVLLVRTPHAGWLAAVGGLLAGGLVLAVVLVTVFTFRSLRRTGLMLLAVPLLTLAVGYHGISRFPERNFKDAQTAGEWIRLHPTLRLALWIVILEDRHLVITDIVRRPEGYVKMGLKPRLGSQHYLQEDRYARAVDLRVSNAGEIRNWGRQGLFLLMGLRARRHDGTADHLHIALPERKKAS